MEFDGKVALVTGGGSGIGEAVSKALAKGGASVLVTDINDDAAARVAQEIESDGGTASAFRYDTTSPEEAKAAVDAAVERYGTLHYAVNNAGIGAKTAVPTGEIDPDDWRRVIDVNLNGVFFGMRYEIPEMLKHPKESAIVNMGSVHGTVAAINNAAYTATKHAIVGLTKNAGAEYGPQGLRINAIGPGYIETPLLRDHLDEATRQAIAAKHPLGRLGTAEEVADLVLFLLSDRASFITGSYQLVDGGYTTV